VPLERRRLLLDPRDPRPGWIAHSPVSAPSSPASSERRLVLPLPFAPTRPIFQPRSSESEAPPNSRCGPRDSDRFRSTIMGRGV
jgi:hypothetical protein